jgi:hypothetical protein
MTEKQKINFFNWLDTYKIYLIDNLTDNKIYDDPWQKSDINRLNKHISFIKKLINNKGHKK